MSERNEEVGFKEKGVSTNPFRNGEKDPLNVRKKRRKNKNNFLNNEEQGTSTDCSFLPGNRHSHSKKNIAQNRLKRLRSKLDTEIKLNEKISAVGVERLMDKSVVKHEKNSSRMSPNNQKSSKFHKFAPRVNSASRNIASERLKIIKKELQIAIQPKEKDLIMEHSTSTEKEKDLVMEVDEEMNEAIDKPAEIEKLQSDEKNYSSQGTIPLSKNEKSYFDIVPFMNYEICKIREEPSYMALHTNFVIDVEMDLDAAPTGDLLIVIDTNVFLSHLKFIEYLLDSSIPSYTSHVLVIPWPVIQEIDYAMKKDDPRLSLQARYANNFINDCLKKKHPRFFGQSLIDFKENFKNAVNVDDFILQYCMKFVSIYKKVILLTNDKNLCNKGMMSQVSVYTTKEFAKTFNFSQFYS